MTGGGASIGATPGRGLSVRSGVMQGAWVTDPAHIGGGLGLTKVERVGIVRWQGFHLVECAVREDSSSPAAEFLDHLRQGMWEDDPDSSSLPDDEQVADYYKLLHKMAFLAAHGEPERRGDVNYLHSGIWEFKVARKRLAFYDTDGKGNWSPKGKVEDAKDAEDGATHWWFPAMDKEIRLLNAWPKLGQKAEPSDIELAVTIAREDVRHDES